MTFELSRVSQSVLISYNYDSYLNAHGIIKQTALNCLSFSKNSFSKARMKKRLASLHNQNKAANLMQIFLWKPAISYAFGGRRMPGKLQENPAVPLSILPQHAALLPACQRLQDTSGVVMFNYLFYTYTVHSSSGDEKPQIGHTLLCMKVICEGFLPLPSIPKRVANRFDGRLLKEGYDDQVF